MSGNIMDYLEWRGDVTFSYSRFNAVDALILSTITYINYPNANEEVTTFKKGYEEWKELPDNDKFRGLSLVRKKTEKFAKALTKAKRFGDIKITKYVEISSEQIEQQFSAMTFILPDGNIFIGFRGTDSSLVGWKENFNMAVIDGTPSQLEATKYVNMIAKEYPDKDILIGGHSKGGNLAIWAGTYVEPDVQQKLKRVFVFDAPGLSRNVFESDEYNQIKDRIISFVPECSIVGILMYNPPQLVVKSDAEALMQHDQFSWQIKRNAFEYLLERKAISRKMEKKLDATIEKLNPDEYIRRVNKIYDDIKSTANIKKSVENFIKNKNS